jgi:hypothetical protein
MRKMAVYNPIPNHSYLGPGFRNVPIRKIIEDPNLRESWNSHPVQAADLCAFLIYQYLAPNSFIRKKGAKGLFRKLDAVLNKRASIKDPFGIVYL